MLLRPGVTRKRANLYTKTCLSKFFRALQKTRRLFRGPAPYLLTRPEDKSGSGAHQRAGSEISLNMITSALVNWIGLDLSSQLGNDGCPRQPLGQCQARVQQRRHPPKKKPYLNSLKQRPPRTPPFPTLVLPSLAPALRYYLRPIWSSEKVILYAFQATVSIIAKTDTTTV